MSTPFEADDISSGDSPDGEESLFGDDRERAFLPHSGREIGSVRRKGAKTTNTAPPEDEE